MINPPKTAPTAIAAEVVFISFADPLIMGSDVGVLGCVVSLLVVVISVVVVASASDVVVVVTSASEVVVVKISSVVVVVDSSIDDVSVV